MKSLESLENFKAMNATELNVIQGGMVAQMSRKKDVSSDRNDSFKRDQAQ